VFYSNYVPFLHHFRDKPKYWSKIAVLTYPTSIWCPSWGSSCWNYAETFSVSSWAIVWHCLCDPRFGHLCNLWQTDEQTHDDSIYHASIALRGKNCRFWPTPPVSGASVGGYPMKLHQGFWRQKTWVPRLLYDVISVILCSAISGLVMDRQTDTVKHKK